MTHPEVVIQVVNFNQASLISTCLNAVGKQTYQHVRVMLTDNGSTDGSPELIRRQFPHVALRLNARNAGYGVAHNAMLSEHRAPFVLVLNVDVRLAPTYVEELVRVLLAQPGVGMVQGKVLQWDADGTGRIDSLGVRLYRNRRNDLLGYGEVDRGQYDRPMEIFGCDGAAALYRRAMLDDVRCGDEVYDEAFFLFREDVDLAWRARWGGWTAWYVPTAVAWHVRRYKPGSRRAQSRWLRRFQLRNRYFLLVKHESGRTLWRDLGSVCWFELRALAYATCVEPHYWLAYANAVRHLPRLWRARRRSVARRRVPAEAMRRWYS